MSEPKLIEIRGDIILYRDVDRWGERRPIWRVVCIRGFVSEDFWTDLQEFQNFSFGPETKSTTRASALLKRSGGLIWQFRAFHSFGSEYERNYIRMTASFGGKTLKRWKWHDYLTLGRLRCEAFILNLFEKAKWEGA